MTNKTGFYVEVIERDGTRRCVQFTDAQKAADHALALRKAGGKAQAYMVQGDPRWDLWTEPKPLPARRAS